MSPNSAENQEANRIKMATKALVGNTLAEYSVLIGLVVLGSIASLSLLGNSANGLFGKANQDLQGGSAQSLVSLQFGGGGQAGMAGNGGGSATGGSAGSGISTQQSIGITEGNSTGTNATATEGATNKIDAIYQNSSAALQMEGRLSSNMDPALYEWASQITRFSKLSAGAAGVLNNLSEFQASAATTAIGGQQANPDSITNSLITYQAELQKLISNPPAGANLSDVNFYSSLGGSVANNINLQTEGKTTKINLANTETTQVLSDFSQYMSDTQLSLAIHKTAQTGEAKQVSTGLDTAMTSSDALNQSNP